MKKNCKYIVKYRDLDYRKLKVLEVTKETYYLHNLDADSRFRISKKKFEEVYVVVEELNTTPYPYSVVDLSTGGPIKPNYKEIPLEEALEECWLNITDSAALDERNNTICYTGKGGSILFHEMVLNRKLTKEERDLFKGGMYEVSSIGVKYLGKYE